MFPIQDKATQLELERIEQMSKLPTGMVVEFYGEDKDIPLGWLKLDGSVQDIYEFPILFETLRKVPNRITYQTSKTFKLPIAAGKIIKV